MDIASRSTLARISGSVAAIVLAAGPLGAVQAAVTVDGTRDVGYGAALSVQTNNTGFGDNTSPTVDEGSVTPAPAGIGYGSELDAAYGVVQGDTLYLMLTGNVEQNFNHLNIFIGNGTGTSATHQLNLANGNLKGANGLTFAPGFNPTYALDINGGGTPDTVYVDHYDLSGGTTTFLGSFATGVANNTLSAGGHSITIAQDNSNILGVNGNTGTAADPAAAQAVLTGTEVAIPLSELGGIPASGVFTITALINGGGNGFLSNQVLGGLPAVQGNLGNPAAVSLPAETAFTVAVPEPASIGVIAIAGLYMGRRRGRRW